MYSFTPLKTKLLRILSFVFFMSMLFDSRCFAYQGANVWNLSKTNASFIGRKEKLQEIYAFFKKGNKDILALTGGPGFGKTQIAKQYAYQFEKNYNFIWWIDAQQDLPSQFIKLAHALNHLLPKNEKIIPSTLSQEALIHTIHHTLRVKNISYLLIFDNVETYTQIEKFIPPTYQQPRKHVLLTSRFANIWIDKIEIGKFDRKESIFLIKQNLPKEKERDMEKLAETLSDYPLGLTLAIGFIKTFPTATISKFIEMHMNKALRNGENLPNLILDQYSHDAQATLSLSLKMIKERSPEALHSLLFMSLLNSKDIPEIYIDLWLKKNKSSLTADEAIKYVYEQSLIGVSETTEFKSKKTAQGDERVHYLSIHDFIHQLVNETIPLEEKQQLVERAAETLLEIFGGASEVFTKKILNERIHLLHAQKLCENARNIKYSSQNLLKLKIRIFECYMGSIRDFEAANLLLQEIEEDFKKDYRVDPYSMALFRMNKGFLSAIHSQYDQALLEMQQGLSLLNTLKGYDEERLRAFTNLAQYHTLLGEIELAQTFIEQGKPLFERSSSTVFGSLFIFAWSFFLNAQGKFTESLDVLRKAEVYTTLNEDYPTLFHSILYQKGETFIKLKLFKEAGDALAKCEETLKTFFQERKSMTLANVLMYKSLLFIYKNTLTSQVFQDLKEALRMYEECYKGPKNHRNQAYAYLVMGKAYAAKEDFKTALQQYRQSEEIYDAILKEKKIDDISELYRDLAFLGTKMKDESLTYHSLKTHTHIFGLDHPRTKDILQHLVDHKLLVFNQ